jgi:hypothetical protein
MTSSTLNYVICLQIPAYAELALDRLAAFVAALTVTVASDRMLGRSSSRGGVFLGARRVLLCGGVPEKGVCLFWSAGIPSRPERRRNRSRSDPREAAREVYMQPVQQPATAGCLFPKIRRPTLRIMF